MREDSDIPMFEGQTDPTKFHRDEAMCATPLTEAAYYGGAHAAVHLMSVHLMQMLFDRGASPDLHRAAMRIVLRVTEDIGKPAEKE